MTKVSLPRSVSGEELLEACVKAAEEMGWQAEPRDDFSKNYTLGSVSAHDDYEGTNIDVRGRWRSQLQVRGIIKRSCQSSFYLWLGGIHGRASEARVQQYLSAVSQHLGD